MSPRAPAGMPTRNTGKLVAVCIKATRNGEGESELISQTPPTFCIQVPMFETRDAIHSARNTGYRSGLQAEVGPSSAMAYRMTSEEMASRSELSSPPIFQLDAKIVRVMAPRTPE